MAKHWVNQPLRKSIQRLTESQAPTYALGEQLRLFPICYLVHTGICSNWMTLYYCHAHITDGDVARERSMSSIKAGPNDVISDNRRTASLPAKVPMAVTSF